MNGWIFTPMVWNGYAGDLESVSLVTIVRLSFSAGEMKIRRSFLLLWVGWVLETPLVYGFPCTSLFHHLEILALSSFLLGILALIPRLLS